MTLDKSLGPSGLLSPSLRWRSCTCPDAAPVCVVRMVSTDAKGISCARTVCSPRGAGTSEGITAKAGGVVPGAFSQLKKVERLGRD